jgi:hypothetical protein
MRVDERVVIPLHSEARRLHGQYGVGWWTAWTYARLLRTWRMEAAERRAIRVTAEPR